MDVEMEKLLLKIKFNNFKFKFDIISKKKYIIKIKFIFCPEWCQTARTSKGLSLATFVIDRTKGSKLRS